MRDFAYARAGTAESVVGTLGDAGTVVIAGGTELLNGFRRASPLRTAWSTSAA